MIILLFVESRYIFRTYRFNILFSGF
uniref:Uncharacterized protein n=1 Tax=Rhizophora mucronata TaxID=61149 RepID=A0A2P2QMA6_RHIMU